MNKWFKVLGRNVPHVIHEYFSSLRKWKKNPRKYDLQTRYNLVKRRLAKVVKDFNSTIIVEGKENIPDTVSVFYPNHISAGDPLPLFEAFDKPTSFVAKIEIEKWPFVSTYFKVIEGEFINRKDLKQSLKVMMKIQEDLVKNHNKNWVIFPEGTRNKDVQLKLKEFHHGSFRPAVKAGVPIVPVAMLGTHRVLSTKYVLKNYPIHIKFLKPIMPEEYKGMDTKAIAKMVQAAIEKELCYNLREKDIKACLESNPDFRPNLLK